MSKSRLGEIELGNHGKTLDGNEETESRNIENEKYPGAVLESKLEEIMNSTPEQLQERMYSNLSEMDEDQDDIKNADDAHETPAKADGIKNKDEADELAEDEINRRQVEEIKQTLKRIFNGENLTLSELGNLGEMMMDQYYISQGYKPLKNHRVTGLKDKPKPGIDGVYEKTNPNGTKQYVIADAKYNKATLDLTKYGKQMSDNWIDIRLNKAVGKEKADEIKEAYNNDNDDGLDAVLHEVYHIDPNIDENGNIHTDTQKLDEDGNKKRGTKKITEYIDKFGNVTYPNQVD